MGCLQEKRKKMLARGQSGHSAQVWSVHSCRRLHAYEVQAKATYSGRWMVSVLAYRAIAVCHRVHSNIGRPLYIELAKKYKIIIRI